jgi:hypothetical protein
MQNLKLTFGFLRRFSRAVPSFYQHLNKKRKPTTRSFDELGKSLMSTQSYNIVLMTSIAQNGHMNTSTIRNANRREVILIGKDFQLRQSSFLEWNEKMKSEHKCSQHKASNTVSKFTMVLVDIPCRAAQL